ncbi:unnamed protein product, partial [Ectocarpus fasciculatus]
VDSPEQRGVPCQLSGESFLRRPLLGVHCRAIALGLGRAVPGPARRRLDSSSSSNSSDGRNSDLEGAHVRGVLEVGGRGQWRGGRQRQQQQESAGGPHAVLLGVPGDVLRHVLPGGRARRHGRLRKPGARR